VYYDDYPERQVFFFLVFNYAILLTVAETRTYGKARHLNELWKETFLLLVVYH
jgi:hypothetical protein